ncbi:MAG: penicillin-binding protein activator [Parvularculaceae bacterium]|nr:penicillin-binding protein activator [Parvularculaceae bacterium]
MRNMFMRHRVSSILARVFTGAAFIVVAACSSGPSGQGPTIARDDTPDVRPEVPAIIPGEEKSEYDERGFVQPLHMQDDEPVRVGLLLPFTGGSDAVQRVASAMFDAAQLAAFEAGDNRFLLIPKDTRGTPEGAAAAARSALADGAEIILGPLFSQSVDAAAPVARAAGAPMIAFSSDMRSAGDGVFLLSFPPEIEIARVTDYAVTQGMWRFGLIAPANEFGQRVSTSFSQQISLRGGILVHEERYEQDPDAMLAPAKRLAAYSKEVIPPELRHGYDPQNPAASGVSGGVAQGYQAVLMPEQGTLLRALAPLLPYYNVNTNEVKLLGISAWDNPRLTREPALRGGWFAAPDPEISAAFKQRYAAAFGEAPPKLASLSYDATLLAARLGQTQRRRDRFDVDAIANPYGYFGADGLFRLRADGAIERGLAILEIQPGGIRVIDPAPQAFAPSF